MGKNFDYRKEVTNICDDIRDTNGYVHIAQFYTGRNGVDQDFLKKVKLINIVYQEAKDHIVDGKLQPEASDIVLDVVKQWTDEDIKYFRDLANSDVICNRNANSMVAAAYEYAKLHERFVLHDAQNLANDYKSIKDSPACKEIKNLDKTRTLAYYHKMFKDAQYIYDRYEGNIGLMNSGVDVNDKDQLLNRSSSHTGNPIITHKYDKDVMDLIKENPDVVKFLRDYARLDAEIEPTLSNAGTCLEMAATYAESCERELHKTEEKTQGSERTR